MNLVERIKKEMNEEPGLLNFLYPYARFLTPTDEEPIIQNWNQTLTSVVDGLLYIHIPFCERKCNFCDFATNFGKDNDEIENYVKALEKEMDLVKNKLNLSDFHVEALYIGGGTPSLLTPSQCQRILKKARDTFHFAGNEEITFEMYARADQVLPLLPVLVEGGVTRVSLAAQDLNDQIIAMSGRTHTAQDVVTCYDTVRKAGIAVVNLDLMVGILGQTPETWTETIRKIISMNVDQVSINPFSNRHPGIIWYKKRGTGELPTLAQTKKMYFSAQEVLESYGYEQKTRVNFQCGHEYRYESGVINLQPRLGVGMDALSLTPDLSYRNRSDFKSYFEKIAQGKLPIQDAYTITGANRFSRWMFFKALGLHFDKREFEDQFGLKVGDIFREEFAALEETGLVKNSNNVVCCTKEGAYYSTLLQRVFYNQNLLKMKDRLYSRALPVIR